MSETVDTIRQQVREQRRTLDEHQRAQASAALCRHILHHPLFTRARNIALYLANDGEIDLGPLFEPAWQRGKHTYVPVLSEQGKQLSFAPLDRDTPMAANRFGIPEPVIDRQLGRTPHQLDLVLTPLVAFDNSGNRVGMGGGFYDRSFAFLRRQQRWQHPHLVGIGYEFQRLETLPAEEWDVPLHGAFTDAGFYDFRNPGSP